MSKARVLFKYWLPVGVWMLLIFCASSDTLSSAHTSRIIGPIVRWLAPNISEVALERIVFRVRKCAHMVEYAMLAWLVWRAIRRQRRSAIREWARPDSSRLEFNLQIAQNPAHFNEGTLKRELQPWRWSEFGIAVLVVTLYGASDEFHQMFVKSRMASGWDVLIDACGGSLGLLLLWCHGRLRKKW